jgi:hypothetical protein
MKRSEEGAIGRLGAAAFQGLEPQRVHLPLDRPVLLVVVDTEEEFDWDRPFDRHSTGTKSVSAQDRAHAIYDQFGVVPTYVIDYPVATSPVAARYLRGLVDAGRAQFGTHCHPWVTPPFNETVSVFNSFHGNLPPEIEAAKIRSSTDAVAQVFGQAPHVFKAGRYGVGPNTLGILKELGYTVDCSFVPYTSFAPDEGPSFHGTPDQPFFTDSSRSLLEVPLTVGVSGRLHRLGRRHPDFFEHPLSRRCRLPGIGSRLGLLERARLSPEGFDLQTQMRLLKAMVDQGSKVFSLTYHSSTLQPGNTPYVRSNEDLDDFLMTLSGLLNFFQKQLGGSFSTISDIERLASRHRLSSVAG